MNYTTYKAALIAKFTALNLFAEVTGMDKPATGFPMCYVIEKSGDGTLLDTARNFRTWKFDVFIQQEVKTMDAVQAHTILLDAVDHVIAALDQDPTLKVNGEATCERLEVVPVAFGYGSETQPMHAAQLTIAISNCVSRVA